MRLFNRRGRGSNPLTLLARKTIYKSTNSAVNAQDMSSARSAHLSFGRQRSLCPDDDPVLSASAQIHSAGRCAWPRRWRMIMRSISAFAAIVLVGTGSVNVQTAEASGVTCANLWAFLTADQPYSDWYIPTKSGQRSSTGLPASVAGTDVGHYVVYMPNLAVKGGTVHVT